MTAFAPDLSAARTLPELLALRVRATPEGESYRQWDEAAGRWLSVTWAQAGERVQQWSRAIAA
ncbi:MAG TPA: long-chain fatty acid--CoA ligase, partial [Comamonadaceae bacterium]|nr:long-chain fatty acid--CoA ligase [Comamonadaceae bacterium]